MHVDSIKYYRLTKPRPQASQRNRSQAESPRGHCYAAWCGKERSRSGAEEDRLALELAHGHEEGGGGIDASRSEDQTNQFPGIVAGEDFF